MLNQYYLSTHTRTHIHAHVHVHVHIYTHIQTCHTVRTVRIRYAFWPLIEMVRSYYIVIQILGIKVRPGSGFYQFSCILGNMSCLCIHLVTLFNLPCQKKNFIEFFFYVLKYRFSIIPKFYFGEITRVMRHICIFSRDIFSPPIFSWC